jgi:activator of 2-hydroxyglutaryl-CoA dehydratase
VPINAQCVVFAESEVVGLVHAGTPKRDIARAAVDSIARRIASLVGRLGAAGPVALVGGLALSPGLCDCLQGLLGSEVVVPDGPEYACALGAALGAAAGEPR